MYALEKNYRRGRKLIEYLRSSVFTSMYSTNPNHIIIRRIMKT